MPVILLQVNDFQWSMLTCLGPYLLWFVMWTPFSLLLLPLLQCIDLGEHLCYVAVQSFVCRRRDVHLNTVATNTCPTYAKSTEMTIQPLLKSPIKPLLNGSNCTKGACIHLCGMIPACTCLSYHNEPYPSMYHHLNIKHRQCTGLSVTTLQDFEKFIRVSTTL